MLNAEKWKTEILEATNDACEFAVVNGRPRVCDYDISCSICKFDNAVESCALAAIKWMLEDYIKQPIDPEDIRKLIEAHGKRETITICMEEAAEYIQALSKMLRTTDWEAEYQQRRAALIEETADVLISVLMSAVVYNLSAEEIAEAERQKMARNLERIRE